MNILHVVNISFVIPFFLGKQLSHFGEKGYKEFVACSPSEELDVFAKRYKFEYKAVEILRKISIYKDLKAVFCIARYIKDKKIDVVVGHTPKGALVAMLAAYITRVSKRIYFRHGLVYETSTGLKRKLLIFIDKMASCLSTKIVCVSPSVCDRSIKDGLNTASKQTLLHNGTCNGIDIDWYDPNNILPTNTENLKERLGVGNGDYVIGFSGRLVRDKGIVELVEAFKILEEQIPNAKLLLVGMLEQRDALPNYIVEEIQQNKRIISTGYVENIYMRDYYSIMDVFILPSYREGFPTSVLEASAMSVPVITTKVTGCIDSIIDEVTGYFVDHNPQEISGRLCQLYENEELRFDMGRNGRRFVVDNFSQELIWQEIEKLYV